MSVTWNDTGWLWIGFAIVTAGFAEQKGRSRWVWFVLGLLLGPLATALVVVWARPEPREAGLPSRDVRRDFAIGSGLAAAALAVVALTTGLAVFWIVAAVALLVAGVLTLLVSRVPAGRLR